MYHSESGWDPDKCIYDKKDLLSINKRRDKSQRIPIVTRNDKQEQGLRANEDFTYGKRFLQVVMPFHNEFVIIWLYIAIAIYFYIQLILILIKDKSYLMANKQDWFLIFMLTLGICISLTLTIFYLILYPKDQEEYKFWYMINLSGLFIMVYFFAFVFFASQMVHEP